jgi:hypothetical protein
MCEQYSSLGIKERTGKAYRRIKLSLVCTDKERMGNKVVPTFRDDEKIPYPKNIV